MSPELGLFLQFPSARENLLSGGVGDFAKDVFLSRPAPTAPAAPRGGVKLGPRSESNG